MLTMTIDFFTNRSGFFHSLKRCTMHPVDVARHEAFLDLGIDIDVDFARKGRPLAVAEQHIRYKGPLR